MNWREEEMEESWLLSINRRSDNSHACLVIRRLIVIPDPQLFPVSHCSGVLMSEGGSFDIPALVRSLLRSALPGCLTP
jgi:hypothetical protein